MFDIKSEDSIVQCLNDMGCSQQDIVEFLKYSASGNQEQELTFLNSHRDTLLDRLHQNQKQIDCLDYFVYYIQKQDN